MRERAEAGAGLRRRVGGCCGGEGRTVGYFVAVGGMTGCFGGVHVLAYGSEDDGFGFCRYRRDGWGRGHKM